MKQYKIKKSLYIRLDPCYGAITLSWLKAYENIVPKNCNKRKADAASAPAPILKRRNTFSGGQLFAIGDRIKEVGSDFLPKIDLPAANQLISPSNLVSAVDTTTSVAESVENQNDRNGSIIAKSGIPHGKNVAVDSFVQSNDTSMDAAEKDSNNGNITGYVKSGICTGPIIEVKYASVAKDQNASVTDAIKLNETAISIAATITGENRYTPRKEKPSGPEIGARDSTKIIEMKNTTDVKDDIASVTDAINMKDTAISMAINGENNNIPLTGKSSGPGIAVRVDELVGNGVNVIVTGGSTSNSSNKCTAEPIKDEKPSEDLKKQIQLYSRFNPFLRQPSIPFALAGRRRSMSLSLTRRPSLTTIPEEIGEKSG